MPSHPSKIVRPPGPAALSLVEMIAVMAIIVIMLSLLAPAVSSFNSTAGRSGAVNILMNTLEQARVAALESGRTVYVVLHGRAFPEADRILVLRDPDPLVGGNYEAMSRWIDLPKGVLLHKVARDYDILSVAMPTAASSDFSFDKAKSPLSLDLKSGDERMNLIAFNAYGAVAFPGLTKLMLIVSEGVRGNGATEAIIGAKKENAGGFEIISLRRYTGRASLEVSTL